MICEKCGNSFPDNAKFCTKCGTKVEDQEKNHKKCPACGFKNPTSAKFCKKDGHPFDQDEREGPPAPAEPVSEKKNEGVVCPKCGSHYPPNTKFCKKDGALLAAAEEKVEAPYPSARKPQEVTTSAKQPSEAKAEPSIAEKPSEGDRQSGWIACPKCKTPNPITAKYCSKDGFPLKTQPALADVKAAAPGPRQPRTLSQPKGAAKREPAGKSSWRWVAPVLVLVFILSGGAVGGYFYFLKTTGESAEPAPQQPIDAGVETEKEEGMHPSAEMDSARASACVNNLKQLGLILGLYATENRDKFPPIDSRKNNFIFDGRMVYPEYLTDIAMCACPSNPEYNPKTTFRLTTNAILSDGYYGSQSVGFQAGTVHPNCITDQSYVYLGWAVTNDAEAQALFEVYDRLHPLDYDRNFSVAKGKGNGGGGVINRLSPGVDRFFGSMTAADIPIVWENPLNISSSKYYHLSKNGKPAGNVLYLDGHVELVEFNSKFPMTKAFAHMLDARKCEPLPYCTEGAAPVAVAVKAPRSEPMRPSVSSAEIERDVNRSLQNEGLSKVYLEVDKNFKGTLRGSVSYQAEKSRAVSIAKSHGRLLDVTDRIEVKPPPPAIAPRPSSISPAPQAPVHQVDPSKLEGDINRALRNAGLGGVTAAVADDFAVTLKGSVKTTEQKNKAFQITSKFEGMRILKDMVFVVEE